MIITSNGHSCFTLKTKDVTIVTDPYDNTVFATPLRLEADYVTVSHEHYDHNYTDAITNESCVVVRTSCEFEKVRFTALDSYHDDDEGSQRGINRIFLIETDGLRIAHLGDLGHIPDQALLDKLSAIDVLFIPVGGIYTLDAQQAAQVTRMINSRLTIPMHFKSPALNLDIGKLGHYLELMTGDYGVAKADGKSIEVVPEFLTDMSIIALKQD